MNLALIAADSMWQRGYMTIEGLVAELRKIVTCRHGRKHRHINRQKRAGMLESSERNLKPEKGG